MSHFFAYLYRLRFIQRWSLMRNTVPESVAEHSFHTAVLTHALCTIAKGVYGRQVDTDRAVTLAIFHDVAEVITGDIPTPVKHHNPSMQHNMRELEHLAADQLLSMVPPELLDAYTPLVRGTDHDHVMQWVKAADKLAAYLKCVSEVAAGNRDFAVALQQLEVTVRGLGMPEVDYFLERLAPSFGRTLDEITV